DGVRVGQWDLSIPAMREIPMVVPSETEQASIVKFLRHANARIDRAIAAKLKMVPLLEEQNRVFISRSTTGGLESGVPMKKTGYRWLEDVPRHWDLLKCGRVVSFVTSGSRGWSDYYSDDGVIFIQSGNIGRSMELNLSRIQYVRPPWGAEGERTGIHQGDVLVCITGALTGNVAFVDQDLSIPAFVNQHVALVRPRPEIVIPRFLALVLHAEIGRTQFKVGEYGGTKQGLGLADVKSVVVPIPPITEQERILDEVGREKSRIVMLTQRAAAEVELLREFRTRLTSDVVTGQLDVREAAAKLPELGPTDLAAADVDDLEDIDAAAEEFLDEDAP
ncbi:MAG: restriction endonuclease subunit S, partial [Actinobacteria bacterium]|nr:restriction endonuclease subunit S [Actinomycetota bacterium]